MAQLMEQPKEIAIFFDHNPYGNKKPKAFTELLEGKLEEKEREKIRVKLAFAILELPAILRAPSALEEKLGPGHHKTNLRLLLAQAAMALSTNDFVLQVEGGEKFSFSDIQSRIDAQIKTAEHPPHLHFIFQQLQKTYAYTQIQRAEGIGLIMKEEWKTAFKTAFSTQKKLSQGFDPNFSAINTLWQKHLELARATPVPEILSSMQTLSVALKQVGDPQWEKINVLFQKKSSPTAVTNSATVFNEFLALAPLSTQQKTSIMLSTDFELVSISELTEPLVALQKAEVKKEQREDALRKLMEALKKIQRRFIPRENGHERFNFAYKTLQEMAGALTEPSSSVVDDILGLSEYDMSAAIRRVHAAQSQLEGPNLSYIKDLCTHLETLDLILNDRSSPKENKKYWAKLQKQAKDEEKEWHKLDGGKGKEGASPSENLSLASPGKPEKNWSPQIMTEWLQKEVTSISPELASWKIIAKLRTLANNISGDYPKKAKALTELLDNVNPDEVPQLLLGSTVAITMMVDEDAASPAPKPRSPLAPAPVAQMDPEQMAVLLL